MRVASDRKLRRLSCVLAEYQPAGDPFPQSGLAQRLFGASSIRRVLRIGDGEFLQPAVVKRRLEICERPVGFQR